MLDHCSSNDTWMDMYGSIILFENYLFSDLYMKRIWRVGWMLIKRKFFIALSQSQYNSDGNVLSEITWIWTLSSTHITNNIMDRWHGQCECSIQCQCECWTCAYKAQVPTAIEVSNFKPLTLNISYFKYSSNIRYY